jgi:hypothetical protein
VIGGPDVSSILWDSWTFEGDWEMESCGSWLAALSEYLSRLGARAALPRSVHTSGAQEFPRLINISKKKKNRFFI